MPFKAKADSSLLKKLPIFSVDAWAGLINKAMRTQPEKRYLNIAIAPHLIFIVLIFKLGLRPKKPDQD
ncbi:MAG: hypothetical protein ACE5EK_03935 [Nitrospinales bacterium]